MAQTQEISPDEIALYDRQIRLWGVKAQEKIRSARVLLVTLKALGNEIAKNLVLAGISSLTVADNAPVTEEDLGSQFLVTEADLEHVAGWFGQRAEAALAAISKLNPRVTVTREAHEIFKLDPSYFANFDMIIATDLLIGGFSTLNAACRLSKRPFYAAGSHGLYGFIFADLIEHTYVITRDNDAHNPATTGPETVTRSVVSVAPSDKVQVITKRESYQPLILANTSPLSSDYLKSRRRLKQVTPLLPCLRALWEFEKTSGRIPTHIESDLKMFTTLATEKSKELQLPPDNLNADFLRSFMGNLGAELSPVCAFLGGHLAQDVINVLGGKEQPLQNMLLFDGETSAAPIYTLNPIVPTTDGDL